MIGEKLVKLLFIMQESGNLRYTETGKVMNITGKVKEDMIHIILKFEIPDLRTLMSRELQVKLGGELLINEQHVDWISMILPDQVREMGSILNRSRSEYFERLSGTKLEQLNSLLGE